jgi:hypothetical protein
VVIVVWVPVAVLGAVARSETMIVAPERGFSACGS